MARGGIRVTGNNKRGLGRGDRDTSQQPNDSISQSVPNDQSIDSSQRVRGPNTLEQVPNNPSKKRFIEVDSSTEFSDHARVIRSMTSTLKTMFRGPWTTWKEVEPAGREAMWNHFGGLYEWPEGTDALVREVWESCMKKRFGDIIHKARKESVALARAANVNASLEGDINLLRPFNPSWIRKPFWEAMVDNVWRTQKWANLSQSGKRNRSKLEDGTISKHCCGSISIRQHAKRLEKQLKRPPTGVEVYGRTHLRKNTQEFVTPKAGKTVEAYEQAIVAKYGDDTTCHPILDNQTWCDVTGGVKKGRVFGWGSISDPKSLLEGTSSTRTSSGNLQTMYACVREELDAKAAEIDAKAAEIDAKAAEIAQKTVEIDAKQKQMDARYAEMDKMFTAIQNMRGEN